MSDDGIEKTVQSILQANKQSRERFERLASRTVDAIFRSDRDELDNIIRDAADFGSSTEGGLEPLETGDVDGDFGISSDEKP